MKKIIIITISIFFVLLIAFFGFIYWSKNKAKTEQLNSITTFEECVSAGNPVSSTQPPQCQTKDGQMFTKEGAENSDLVNQPNVIDPKKDIGYAVDTNQSDAGVGDQGAGEEIKDENASSIVILNLEEGDEIVTPLTVLGQAKKDWFYSGQFIVRIFDDNNLQLGFDRAKMMSSPDVDGFVDFKLNISFARPKTNGTSGYILFKKSNPTGDDSLDYDFKFPIVFQ